jgi:hypothetical protein
MQGASGNSTERNAKAAQKLLADQHFNVVRLLEDFDLD